MSRRQNGGTCDGSGGIERRLGRAQMNVLYQLSRTNGLGVGALAAVLDVTSGAVSQHVDSLRRAGLVTVEVDPLDARARVVSLTDAARSEVNEFRRGWIHAIAPRFDALSTEEVHELSVAQVGFRLHWSRISLTMPAQAVRQMPSGYVPLPASVPQHVRLVVAEGRINRCIRLWASQVRPHGVSVLVHGFDDQQVLVDVAVPVGEGGGHPGRFGGGEDIEGRTPPGGLQF